MEGDGKTYKVQDFMDRLQHKQITVPYSSLQELLLNHENSGVVSSSEKIPLVEMQEDSLISEKFGPLSKVEPETLTYFKSIQKTIKTKQEGTSPCFYRSYLLSSRLDGDTLQTLICSDQWASKRVTSQVAYSLLNSLFYDRPDGDMDSQTAEECTKTMQKFSTLFDIIPEPSPNPSFSQLAFKPIPDEIGRTICVTQDKGSRPIRETTKKQILMEAHNTLHLLYENHIKACVELLLKIMSLETKEGYLAKPNIRLDPIFLKDPMGSLHALEIFIKETRELLSNHYLEVEQVYQDALTRIVSFSRGNAPQNGEVGKDMLAKAANKLPN
jgi:hypothetical protein